MWRITPRRWPRGNSGPVLFYPHGISPIPYMSLPATIMTDEITAFAAIGVPACLVLLWALSALIDNKNRTLLKDINGTYLRTKEADLREKIIQQKFEAVEMQFKRGEKVFERINQHFDFLRDERLKDHILAIDHRGGGK